VTSIKEQQPRKTRLKPNPFTPQEPVTDPNKFAGRGEAIRNAVDALFNNKNIIVTGERGIGKSSVAYQL
jgi:MoxR-like ATPase